MIGLKHSKRLYSIFSSENIFSAENRTRFALCLESQGIQKSQGLKNIIGSPENQPEASVLIPFCINDEQEAEVLYTRRSGRLSRHVHQIAFPGGMKDPQDESYTDCALRETEEEIGLRKHRIKILTTGTKFLPKNSASIVPVYAIIKNFKMNELRLNEEEVESAFTIPLRELASPNNFRYTQYRGGYSGPVFLLGKYRIWGITAFLTENFLKCLLPKKEYLKRPKIKYIRPFKEAA